MQCSRRSLPERADAAAKVVADAGASARTWQDFRKMLDQQKDIEAVVLATPDGTHKDLDIAILEVGKHLYAEKPLALTAQDCKMVVNKIWRRYAWPQERMKTSESSHLENHFSPRRQDAKNAEPVLFAAWGLGVRIVLR